jgi:hypothetical protein
LHFKKKLSLKSRIKILWQRFFKKDKADIIYEKVDMCYDELDSGEIKNWHLATKDGKRISFRDLDKICIDEVDINS